MTTRHSPGQRFFLLLFLFLILFAVKHPHNRLTSMLTRFKCWNRSRKEPSLEKTFAGLGLVEGLEWNVVGRPLGEGELAGEAYPLDD